MRHPHWMLALVASVAIASGCETPSHPKPKTSVPPAAEPSAPPDLTVRNGGDPSPSAAVQALSGVVKAPDAAVIGSGGSLVNDGGIILYRTLQAPELQPVAGATVTLVDAEGQAVSDETATTDAAGRFSFKQGVASDAPFFVQADFTLAGEAFAFQSLAEVGAEPVEVDAASTLVASKARALVKGGKLKARGLAIAKVARLAAQVRKGLKAEALPHMGKRSRDMAAAFDQLLVDQPELAALAAELAAPAETWQATTVVTAEALRAAKAAGTVFEVDAEGRVYVATATTPVQIVRFAPGGGATPYLTLPADVEGPVRLALSPTGRLHVMGFEKRSKDMVVLAGEGLERRVYARSGAQTGNGVGDRMAVNAAGDVFMALPRRHVIAKFPADGTDPSVLAGSTNEAGYVDGASARFSRPASLAIGPGGALYVADAGNNALRRVRMDGTVSTVAGKPDGEARRGGRGTFARLGAPAAIAVDAEGNVYFTDSKHLQRLSPGGSVFDVAPEVRFTAPGHLAIDGAGNVYLWDVEGIRKLGR